MSLMCEHAYSEIEEDDYQMWFAAYTHEINQMNTEDYKVHIRQDYKDDTQLYPDYLDYVEEWKHHSNELLEDLLQSFIHIMARQERFLKCDCGDIHRLSLFCLDTEIDRTKTYVNKLGEIMSDKCWYKTLRGQLRTVRGILESQNPALPTNEFQAMLTCFQVALTLRAQTPTLLPLDVYKTIWWEQNVRGSTRADATKLLTQIGETARRQIQDLKEPGVFEPKRKAYFLNNRDVLRSHGFHNFIKAAKADGEKYISLVNTLRRRLVPDVPKLKISDLERNIARCKKCAKSGTVQFSIPGIYHGLPGVGKTTAMERDLLVAFDTDWVGVGHSYQAYSELFVNNIPILTNQLLVFLKSGIKIVSICKPEVRKWADGKPMASLGAVKSIQAANPREVYLIEIRNDQYFDDFIIAAQMLHWQQRVLEHQTYDPGPLTARYNIPVEWMKRRPQRIRRLITRM